MQMLSDCIVCVTVRKFGLNIATLCQQLKAVLHGGRGLDGTPRDTELQQTPNQSTPSAGSHDCCQHTPVQSESGPVSRDSHVTGGSTSDRLVADDNNHTPENKILRKSKRKLTATENSSIKVKKPESRTPDNVLVSVTSTKNRTRKSKKQIPAADQTTLTQFYEYDSDNENGLDITETQEPEIKNNNHRITRLGADQKLGENVPETAMTGDDEKTNETTRTKRMIHQSENYIGISKTVTRLRRKSDIAAKDKTPVAKQRSNGRNMQTPVPVSPLSPLCLENTPTPRKTRKAAKTGSPTSISAVSPALQTPRNNSKRSRSNGSASPSVSIATNTPVAEHSRSRVTGSPSTPARSQGKPVMTASPALNKRNAKGETPLQIAAIKNDVAKVQELLEVGANPNVRDNAGWTPLHEACNHGYLAVARLLLDKGAMINVPGLENDSPLHDAISNGRTDCVKLLVSRGASLTVRNLHGWTPRDLARTEEMQQALRTPVTVNRHAEDQVLDVLQFQQPCFLGTALSRDQKIVLQKCASVLQAKLVEDCTAEVTHVITSCNLSGMCPRTIKYLHGVLMGKWILNMEWVDTCLEYQSRVLEEAFEVQGTSTCPDSQAPYKGRMNRRNQLPGLFDGCQFYFHGNYEDSTPEKQDLVNLVKAGGGKILTREPKPGHIDDTTLTVPYHSTSGSYCCIFIVHESSVNLTAIRTPVMCSVPIGWVLDSAAQFRLLDLPGV